MKEELIKTHLNNILSLVKDAEEGTVYMGRIEHFNFIELEVKKIEEILNGTKRNRLFA